jgi:hypothetical protein
VDVIADDAAVARPDVGAVEVVVDDRDAGAGVVRVTTTTTTATAGAATPLSDAEPVADLPQVSGQGRRFDDGTATRCAIAAVIT